MNKLSFTKRNLFFASTLVFLTLGFSANAQEIAPVPTDTIYPLVEQAQSDLTVLKKLKISGYIQAQYQKADTAGISSFAGGNFGSGIDNRFMIRRGRLKFLYDNELSQAVVQFDITEKGLAIKDAYLNLTEPWLKTATVTGGVFDRPFGYEISYSSSARETPERSRIFQTLFPGERETGAKLSLQAPKTSRWNWIRLDAGYFNGNGPAVETDSKKDFIGHLAFSKVSKSEKFKWGLGGSYYNGGFTQIAATKAVAAKTVTVTTPTGTADIITTPASTTPEAFGYNYKTTTDAAGNKFFKADTVNIGSITQRQYVGVDAQLSLDWWLGITQIRAEYLQGTQPAASGSSSSLQAAPTGDTYTRNFNGYYGYFIQNIFQTPVQLVVKYDVYDPNTDVSGDQIGASYTATGKVAKTGAADVKYSTLGIGLNYKWNSNVKIMAYYDMVSNETTSKMNTGNTLARLSNDRKDNVFTLRVQYKF